MFNFTGELFGLNARGTVQNMETKEMYDVLPATYEKFKNVYGKEKAEAIEVFALEMLRDNKESAKEFFCKKNGNPFPSLESLRSMYIEYGGNEYELWHDYGDAYIMACKKFNVSKQEHRSLISFHLHVGIWRKN